MAASPSSAYSRTPDCGQGPASADASLLGTLRTLAICTRVPPLGSGSPVTSAVTVRPGPTDATVCFAVDSASPEPERNSKVTV